MSAKTLVIPRTNTAWRQCMTWSSAGIRILAIALPSGTPVCLIEKIRERY